MCVTYFHKYDGLCHLTTFFVPKLLKRWPSDKANHACENMLDTLYVIQGVIDK